MLSSNPGERRLGYINKCAQVKRGAQGEDEGYDAFNQRSLAFGQSVVNNDRGEGNLAFGDCLNSYDDYNIAYREAGRGKLRGLRERLNRVRDLESRRELGNILNLRAGMPNEYMDNRDLTDSIFTGDADY